MLVREVLGVGLDLFDFLEELGLGVKGAGGVVHALGHTGTFEVRQPRELRELIRREAERTVAVHR